MNNLFFFVIQKQKIAINFLSLLKAGIEKAIDIKDFKLAETLKSNLSDEEGRDELGVVHAENSHAFWRACFLEALDIKKEDHNCEPLPSAKSHLEALYRLESKGTALEIAGAILMTERIIPFEYRSVQSSRDDCFPEKFVTTLQDPQIDWERKKLACKYIDDHIIHDANLHFPMLLAHLENYQGDVNGITEICHGINIVKKVRYDFFNEVGNLWLKG